MHRILVLSSLLIFSFSLEGYGAVSN